MDSLFERARAALERAQSMRRETAALLAWANAHQTLWDLRHRSLLLQQRVDAIARDMGASDDEVQFVQHGVSLLRNELRVLTSPDRALH